ncbi:efflux RND transporter periplasmic adaptor subunit [Bacteroidota bacterium]
MKTNKLLRYLLIATVLLIVLAVVGKKAGWFGKEEAVEVAVEKVERRNIIETITANGKVQPETEIKISPDVSGEIVELHVKEGDMVESGQLLARIKPEVYISARDRTLASVNSSKARHAQARAQFIQKELDYDRNKQLWEQQAISEAEFETAQSLYEVAKAELDAAKYSVKSAEAALAEADENLIKTSIYAPMTGTVSMLLVEKGERVIGAQMMTGTEMMRIADLNRMEVLVEVNENDIVRVTMNDTALIEVDAFLGDKFKGLVTEIANSAKTAGLATDQVTNFEVKVLLLRDSYLKLFDEGYSNPFRPGMSATVDIQTEFFMDVLSAPIQAVTTRADSVLADTAGGEILTSSISDSPDELIEIVFMVNEENKAVAQKVETGIQDNNYIQILEGLREGDEMITAPYNAVSKKLKPGTTVEIVKKEDLFKDDKKKKKD